MNKKTTATYTPQGYLPHIDGLRGLSVLIIFLFHLDVSLFHGGFIGVDIFFVISGFLITRIITREIQAGKFSFANFYARRIKRIFPALFTMLFLSSIAALFFLGPQQFGQHFKALRMASGQISNFYFSQNVDYFALDFDMNTLLHTWSLGVEEQFYLIWPLLLIIIHRFLGLKRTLAVLSLLLVASLVTSEYLVRTNAMNAFYMLHSRAWELAMGGIITLSTLPKIKQQKYIELLSALGLALIISTAMLIDKEGFPGLKAFLPCFGAALIIYSAQQGSGYVHKLLSLRPIVFVGVISYSLYLWHWPLIAFYKNYYGADLTFQAQSFIVILSFALAYCSYKYIEQPARLSKLPALRVIGIGLSAMILFVVSSNLIKNQDKASWRVAYNFDQKITEPNSLDKVCSVEGGAYDKEHCFIGPNKDKYEVILVGDSFASHYIYTVLEWAKSKNLTTRLFMRGACQTWIQSDKVRMKNGKVDTYCMELSKSFYETLEKDKSIKYIFLALAYPIANEETRKSLEKIKSYDKNVYFLGLVPQFKEHPHYCEIKNNLLISKIFSTGNKRSDCLNIDHQYSNDKLAKSLNSFRPLLDELKIPYFDPLPFMQTAFDKDGHFMYVDAIHLNEYGALHLAPHLIEFTDKNP